MTTASARTVRPDAAPVVVRRPAAARAGWIVGGIVLLALCAAASVAFGARDVSFDEFLNAIRGQISGVGEAAIVARVPRTVLAIIVGAALGMSGAALQAVTRNPIADPGILGISSGAGLAVVTGIAFLGIADPYGQMGLAVLGAALASLLVYLVASRGRGGATPLKLALAGAATYAALTSLTIAVLLPRVDVMTTFRFWQIGGVGGAEWDRMAIIAPFLALGALICLLTAGGMNSLALGDDVATGLGTRVAWTRVLAFAGAVILCGVATSIAGPIAFVGLIVPHICRLLLGTDHRWLLPFSAIVGAALLVASDVIGRIVARPEEIEVGIITAVVGAPFFIWIVRRQRVREL